ncbi:MAG TPA: methionyl-tRNA formyltransferase [Methylocella sp.]|nr:methionyl-tRNA formyltransferase [Methylocella sp.]
MRVVFMGTPAFAVPALAAIVREGHTVPAVYTRAPRPGGRRGLAPVLTPVHEAALRYGLEVAVPHTLRTPDAAASLQSYRPDTVVVVAYGLILPKAVLDVPPKGCLNLHASLLPRWRGAAPIQRAIMAGDSETGIVVMRITEGLDEGDIALAERIPIGPDMTAGELTAALAGLGAELIVRALRALERDELVFTPQAETGITYAHKIAKEEARIDWRRPAGEIHNLVRGLSPSPGAFFEADLGKGPERIKVLRTGIAEGEGAPGLILDDCLTVACGEGAIRLLEVQRSGKALMPAAEFLRGAPLPKGTLLPLANHAALQAHP